MTCGSETRAYGTFANALNDLARHGPDAAYLLAHADRVDAIFQEHLADRARWDAEDREEELRGDRDE